MQDERISEQFLLDQKADQYMEKKNPTGQPSEMVHKLSIALRIEKRCDTCICLNHSISSIFHLNIIHVHVENCLKVVLIRGDI